jgi:prepilin-type N-terminal cleavage/methylation domain-containing protein
MKRMRLSNRLKKAFVGHSRGFTLVEVLITIGLLGFIALAFFSFMSAATSSLVHADERTIAESLARSQLEYVKNQTYNSATPTYTKIPDESVPAGYTIWSVDAEGAIVNGGASDPVIGIRWDSASNTTSYADTGLQLIALVIGHEQEPGQYRMIYTFTNNSPNWVEGDGKEMTLQGYVRASDT